jgi:hypothetical protein
MKYLVFMTLFSLTLFVNRPNEDVRSLSSRPWEGSGREE